MKDIDDFELMDRDFDEFIRRGLEELADEHPGCWADHKKVNR